ncbi:MAG: 6,7-dimethyl-8-ribityllumazine synthase [Chitinophagaceae bacterium]|nr:6,7-dimethyl-8-ribityllumazine synthase [Chitinophagaceae bacterium]
MADIANSKLLHTDTGILSMEDACVVLVKTEWNAAIIDELERGCVRVLEQHKVGSVVVLTVPGAVEIPFAIKQFWERTTGPKPAAFIALGCVIKGDTPHFEYVCQSVTDGVTQLNLQLPAPTIFGVLTVNTDEQAQERIGGKHGHKGEEAAITALKMISLQRSIK